MQKHHWFCIFMHFCDFTLLNKRFVNNLTITFRFACFTYTFQSWYFSFEKAWVLGRESMGFRLWKHGFYDLKPMLSDRNLMPFWKRSPCSLKLYIYATLAAQVGRWSPRPVLPDYKTNTDSTDSTDSTDIQRCARLSKTFLRSIGAQALRGVIPINWTLIKH